MRYDFLSVSSALAELLERARFLQGKASPIYTLVWINIEGTNGSLRRFDKGLIVPTHSHSLAMSCRQAAAKCRGQSFSVGEELKIDKTDPKVKRFGPRSPWNRWKDGTKMIQEWVRCLPVGFKHVTGFCPYLVRLSYPSFKRVFVSGSSPPILPVLP